MIDVIHTGDALTIVKTLQNNSVNCIVTSPPYFGLRDYDIDGQIGLEETPQAYVAKLVELFREARRVLRDDGVVWLNLGDSYGSSGGDTYTGFNARYSGTGLDGGKQARTAETFPQTKINTGMSSKNLLGIPWRVAFGLQDDGWILRSDIVWSKPNPMPESVTDRPTKAHEYVFLFAKSQRYWYDADAIKEPAVNGDPNQPRGSKGVIGQLNAGNRANKASANGTMLPNGARIRHGIGATTIRQPLEYRNKRDVWTVTTKPFSGAHFATFPPDLIEPMILAGCPEGGVVLDPFMGSGTTALVALKNRRHYIGIELNPDYAQMAQDRLNRPLAVKLF